MSQWDDDVPEDGERTAPFQVTFGDDADEEDLYNPITYDRDMRPPDIGDWDEYELAQRGYAPLEGGYAPPVQGGYAPGDGGCAAAPAPHRVRAGRARPPRWLAPVVIALAVATASGTFVLVSDTGKAVRGSGVRSASMSSAPATAAPASPAPASPAPASPAPDSAAPASARPASPAPPASQASPVSRPPVTAAQARAILDGYTATNNAANASMSDTTLGSYETGSSYALDAGIYRALSAEQAAPYPAFGPVRAQFYIPLEQAAYPHWFAAGVTNADMTGSRKVTGEEYLVFTQAAPGAPWKDAAEPFVLRGHGMPRIALDSGGFATAIGPGTMGLAVQPGQAGQLTAESMDGSGPVADPGNLADLQDKAFWRDRLPASGTVTVRHSAQPGDGLFGLRTADGGALLFYTVAAQLTLAPPPGQTMRLTVPGFYDGTQHLTVASLGYLEQYATYDPPRGGGAPRVVADFSGITARD